MTNQQGAPEALRLADAIDPFERKNAPDHHTSKVAADELRRLHAENERLAALVEAQQPAPSAAPTQDMIAAVLQLVDLEQGDVKDHRYDDGSKLAEQICKAVLALVPQPAPSAAAAVVVYEQKENEMQVWFRPARMHGHPERTPIKATITKDRGNGIVDLTYDDGEFSGNARAVPNALRLPRNVREQVAVWWDVGFEMDFQTAVDNSLKKKKDDPPPQPSPTPQADTAPSAAAPVGEAPLPLLVRDIAADLGTTPIQVCTALAQLGFGGHSVNMAVTPRMAQSLRAHFASPTPQADSQPAPVLGEPTWTVFNSGAKVAEVESLAEAMEYLTPERLSWQWYAVCVVDQSNMPKARAPADSVTAPAGGAMDGWKLAPEEPTLHMGWAYLDAARESDPLRTHTFNHAGYRAMLAAAPTPPTQAQAGAVPLTDEQWQRIADLTDSILTRATKDEIERVIGIKGGQHGGM